MIEAHLRTRLLSEAHGAEENASPSYAAIVKPALEGFGTACELVGTYSAEKRTEVVTVAGRTYLVFDQALSETFNLFNRLTHLRVEGAGSFIAAALHRPLAEALREAQEPLLCAYFVRRAVEAKPFMRLVLDANPSGGDMFWQNLVILFHEAAHALSPDSAERAELSHAAVVLASGLANDLILGMTGQMSGLLETDSFGDIARKDVEAWTAAKDDLNIGDDAIYDTYAEVGSDPRFLDELMCDFFAIQCVTKYLGEGRSHSASADFPDIAIGAFQACYSAFLHMRLLKYFSDVTRDLPRHRDQAKLDPLKQRWLVELTFRGNIVVQRLLDAPDSFDLPGLRRKLAERFAALQDAHMASLLNVGNELLERTVLNEEFYEALPGSLEQDGFDLALLDQDEIAFFEEADAIWQLLWHHRNAWLDRRKKR
jgi:hypothetical protein